jgi:hypothetical protein
VWFFLDELIYWNMYCVSFAGNLAARMGGFPVHHTCMAILTACTKKIEVNTRGNGQEPQLITLWFFLTEFMYWDTYTFSFIGHLMAITVGFPVYDQ